MYKVIFCHRMKRELAYAEFHDHWLKARSRLVLELQPAMGFATYAQTHQVRRLNLLYLSIRATRSRVVSSWLSKMPASSDNVDPKLRNEERWDVTDEFRFTSKDDLLSKLRSQAGLQAARRLIADQTSFVRRTAVLISEETIVAPDLAPPSPTLFTIFFLRARPAMTRAEMLGYWGESHKQLVLSVKKTLKYRAFNQLHLSYAPEFSEVVERYGGTAVNEFDGVAELGFGSQWEIVKGLANPATQLANLRLAKDETNFVDLQRSELLFGKHYQFPNPRNPVASTSLPS